MSEGRRARRGRRGKVAGNATGQRFEQQAWQQLKMPFKPTEVVADEQVELIHDAAMRILEDIGIDVLLPEAREIMLKAGATAKGERVYFERELLMQLISTVPEQFTLHARNPAHNFQVGKNFVNFGTVASAPNTNSLDGGRRPGNQQDYQTFLRLMQSLNIMHFTSGYPVEPVDLHPSVRHLHCLSDCVTLTDKVFHCYSLGRDRNRDAIEIARIGRGISREQLKKEPSIFTVINSNSPLKLDEPMLQGIIEMSSLNQPIVLTPFTLAGAMAPVTIAGALAQQNAEALAGIAFSQMVNPGAPAVYGGFTSNVDMKSGAPAFGTPEYVLAAQISGQLARYYNIPFRSSNVCAANTVDAQAGYESTMALWGALTGGTNFVMHGAGWMEGGLSASPEKMMVDADLLQMMAVWMKGVEISEEAFGLDAIRDVGPGGHYFGTAHTMARYKTAFYSPMISDWRNFESWTEAGAPDALQKANKVYKQLLSEYEEPALDPARREELDAFVAKRVEQGGVATDF
uniref:Methyltransferase n=1 Tax=uncultured Thiotrichaceae bacterium TaxID=298394 RepID=A0A6S6SK13_9GAMM|nr:MAG: Trimethylamine methyltransferase family protein [uncultured Thiotrichaceae bacterium]